MGQVILEKEGPVALLILNAPASLNALNARLMAEISQAVDEAVRDKDIRVLILTGTGKAFIAGADIKEMIALSAVETLTWAKLGSDLNVKLEELPIPVIAAINGFALGGGCELAMACDIRIASEKAKLGQPEVGIGVTPGAGGTQRLPRLVGPGRAKELLFTGRSVDAREAEAMGLVDKVVAHDALMEEAMAMARRIAAQAPVAVAQCKRLVNAGTQTDLKTALAMELQAFSLCSATEDKAIGMGAFLRKETEKNFVGR